MPVAPPSPPCDCARWSAPPAALAARARCRTSQPASGSGTATTQQLSCMMRFVWLHNIHVTVRCLKSAGRKQLSAPNGCGCSLCEGTTMLEGTTLQRWVRVAGAAKCVLHHKNREQQSAERRCSKGYAASGSAALGHRRGPSMHHEWQRGWSNACMAHGAAVRGMAPCALAPSSSRRRRACMLVCSCGGAPTKNGPDWRRRAMSQPARGAARKEPPIPERTPPPWRSAHYRVLSKRVFNRSLGDPSLEPPSEQPARGPRLLD